MGVKNLNFRRTSFKDCMNPELQQGKIKNCQVGSSHIIRQGRLCTSLHKTCGLSSGSTRSTFQGFENAVIFAQRTISSSLFYPSLIFRWKYYPSQTQTKRQSKFHWNLDKIWVFSQIDHAGAGSFQKQLNYTVKIQRNSLTRSYIRVLQNARTLIDLGAPRSS